MVHQPCDLEPLMHTGTLWKNAWSWPYQNWGKTLFYMSNRFLETLQVDSDITIIKNSIQITVFKILTTFHWRLPKNIDGFGLAIPKLRDSNLFCMSNTFLEAFLKFQTSWQCYYYYRKYNRNHRLSIVWQFYMEHCLKMLMDLDSPYKNWVKTLYSICHSDS